MNQTETRFVNLGVYPETRDRLNMHKAQRLLDYGERLTVDDILNQWMDAAGVPQVEKQNTAPKHRVLS